MIINYTKKLKKYLKKEGNTPTSRLVQKILEGVEDNDNYSSVYELVTNAIYGTLNDMDVELLAYGSGGYADDWFCAVVNNNIDSIGMTLAIHKITGEDNNIFIRENGKNILNMPKTVPKYDYDGIYYITDVDFESFVILTSDVGDFWIDESNLYELDNTLGPDGEDFVRAQINRINTFKLVSGIPNRIVGIFEKNMKLDPNSWLVGHELITAKSRKATRIRQQLENDGSMFRQKSALKRNIAALKAYRSAKPVESIDDIVKILYW